MPNVKTPIYLHIGLPRTATSYLQKNVFPFIPRINYINKFKPLLLYVSGKDRYQKSVQDKMAVLKKTGRPVFISNESLIGDASIYNVLRIQEMFPEATIILTLRNQYERILSYYMQMVKRGSATTLFSFDTYLSRFQGSLIRENSYYPIVKILHQLFHGRVYVLFFEEFQKNRSGFFQELANIFNLSETVSPDDNNTIQNSSLDIFLLPFFRHLSFLPKITPLSYVKFIEFMRVLDLMAQRTGRTKNRRHQYKQLVMERMGQHFYMDNIKLEKLLGRPLPVGYLNGSR